LWHHRMLQRVVSYSIVASCTSYDATTLYDTTRFGIAGCHNVCKRKLCKNESIYFVNMEAPKKRFIASPPPRMKISGRHNLHHCKV